MIFPSAPLFVLPLGSFAGALIISLILSFLISKFDVKGSKLALIGLARQFVQLSFSFYLFVIQWMLTMH